MSYPLAGAGVARAGAPLAARDAGEHFSRRPKPVKRMADSIVPANLPAGMDAYLGYVDGRWPDYQQIAASHQVPCYGLTVLGSGWAGDGVDAEPGDATVEGAAACIAAELARGVDRPIGYCPQSWAASLVAAVTARGIARPAWRLLTAHYAGEHICGPATCGCPVQAAGTQWVDHGGWDESVLSDAFVTAAAHPGPVVAAPVVVTQPGTVLTSSSQGVTVQKHLINIPTNAAGVGWTPAPLPYPFAQVIDVAVNPGNIPAGQPATPGTAKAAEDGAGTYVELEGCPPNSVIGVWVTVAD